MNAARFSRARGPSILHSRVAVLCFVLLHILCFNYLFGFTVFMFLLLVVNKQCIVKPVHMTLLLGSFAITLLQKLGPKKKSLILRGNRNCSCNCF